MDGLHVVKVDTTGVALDIVLSIMIKDEDKAAACEDLLAAYELAAAWSADRVLDIIRGLLKCVRRLIKSSRR